MSVSECSEDEIRPEFDSECDDEYKEEEKPKIVIKKKNENDSLKNLPSIEEQRKTIQELEKSTQLQIGIPCYIIPSTWFNRWKEHVGYSGNEPFSISLSHPIPTNTIYDKEKRTPKLNLKEIIDYQIITKEVWNQLKQWYGGEDAELDVVEDPKNMKPVAITKKTNTIVRYKEEEKKVIIISREFILDYKKRCLEAFGIKYRLEKEDADEDENQENSTENKVNLPSIKDFRIIDNWHRQMTKELNDDYISQECNIADDNDMVLDFKNEDGEWNFKLNTSLFQTNTNNISYYNYGTPLGPGKVGFQNLGNTCYFNSGVQCLMHSKPLVKALLSPNWKDDINERNPLGMRGKLARAFQSLLTQVWDGTSRVLSPSELKNTMGRFANQFEGWGQQDAHELITFMLDGIHEDLNRCKVKPQVDTVIGDGSNDEETAQKAWENHLKRNDSIIVDHFHGQLRSRLICPNCHKTTVVFDPFMALSLPLSKPHLRTLKIIFVPFDFNEDHQTIDITVPASPQQKDYEDAISHKLQKHVDVILATFSRKSYEFKFIIQLDVSPYFQAIYYAFEIPDTTKIYVPCAGIRTIRKKTYMGAYDDNEPVTPYFLLPVDPKLVISSQDYSHISEDERTELYHEAIKSIKVSAELYFSSVWDVNNPKRIPDNNESISELENFVKKAEFCNEGWKITPVLVYKDYKNYPLIKYDKNPMVTYNKCSLMISPDYATVESGFSYATLTRHLSEIFASDSEGSSSDQEETLKLEDCFVYFSTEETLDEDNKWYCPNCKQFVCANKKMDIWSAPQCLILHLKRFTPMMYISRKDERMVDFPDELDISGFLLGPKNKSLKYQLYAVSEHMGGMGGGHYTAHCVVSEPSQTTGKWYSFNDSNVSESNSAAAHNCYAYVLFYQRMDSECPTLESSTIIGHSSPSSDSSDSDDGEIITPTTVMSSAPISINGQSGSSDESI